MQQQPSLKERQQQQEQRYKKLKDDYEKIFTTPAGKRVLEDILISGNIYRGSFVKDDPYGTHFEEGKRELALHIKFMAEPQPEENEESKKAIKGGT